ncbi:MAG: Esterase/lipase [Gemmatimonadetes bacterium]|nr:Esterase/lipase [Gemmatimonadota bacterium]
MATDPRPHEIVVPRTARYYTLGPTHGFPRELWIVCHGYGQLAGRFIRDFAPLDDGSRLIVAPEALSLFYLESIPERRSQKEPRVGATWMTREHREAEIADQITYLDRLMLELRHHLSGASPRIVVLGFSQGTATVSRWLGAGNVRVDQMVLWGGQTPSELEMVAWSNRLQDAKLTFVVGDADEYVTPKIVAREVERLSTAGIAFSLQRFSGGHVIDADALAILAASFQGR